MKKIVLISSGQPSFNPRLVKEANALASAGYEVLVVHSYWNSMASLLDIQLFQEVKWGHILVGGQPKSIKYFFTRARHKLFKWLANKVSFSYGIAEIAKGRAYSELLTKAKSIKADLYIAHNLAALPIAVKAALQNHAKAGFDAEDFHRQEVTDDTNAPEYKLDKSIEDKYLPLVDYCTAASPLIAKSYKQLYPGLDFITINNVFLLKYQPKKIVVNNSNIIKLFWFSQTIGKNRGLEQVLSAMGRLGDIDIHFTLAGTCSDEMQVYLDKQVADNYISTDRIHIVPPMPEVELFALADQHDIGLALEPGFCYNNNIALSNKVFSYLISGLAVIATNTLAQQAFIEAYPSVGKSFAIGDIDSLEQIIRFYYNDRDALWAAKIAAYNLAKNELNWELESKRFLSVVASTV